MTGVELSKECTRLTGIWNGKIVNTTDHEETMNEKITVT